MLDLNHVTAVVLDQKRTRTSEREAFIQIIRTAEHQINTTDVGIDATDHSITMTDDGIDATDHSMIVTDDGIHDTDDRKTKTDQCRLTTDDVRDATNPRPWDLLRVDLDLVWIRVWICNVRFGFEFAFVMQDLNLDLNLVYKIQIWVGFGILNLIGDVSLLVI